MCGFGFRKWCKRVRAWNRGDLEVQVLLAVVTRMLQGNPTCISFCSPNFLSPLSIDDMRLQLEQELCSSV